MRSLVARFGGLAGWLLPSVLVVAGLVAAVTPLAPNFFEGAPYAHAGLVAGLAVLVAVVAQRLLAPALALLVGVAALTGLLLVVLADLPRVAGVPDELGPVSVWRHVATGWSNLLASPQPIEMSPELMALPLAVVWAAAYVTVMIVGASRSTTLSVLPLLAAAMVFLLLGPGSLSLVAGAVLGLCVLGHVAVRASQAELSGGQPSAMASTDADGPPLWRYALRSFVVVGIPAVVLAGLVGGATAALVGGDPDRTDLHGPAGTTPRDELTPLAGLRGQLLSETSTTLFTMRFDGAEALPEGQIDRIRVATLERYDGALWTSGGVFQPIVRQVRSPDQTGRSSVEVSVEVSVSPEYDSSYLPVVGLLRTVDGQGLALNEDSDTLIRAGEVGPRFDYRFAAVVPSGPRPDTFTEERPPGDWTGLDGPEPPATFRNFIGTTTKDGAEGYALLEQLETAMRDPDGFGYSVLNAYSGHSYPILAAYLSPELPPNFQVNRQGYAEQAAAAFTLLARLSQLPARVAVGYLIEGEAAAAALAAGDEIPIGTGQAHAWSEVFIDGEWVVFDPIDRTERPAKELTVPELERTGAAPVDDEDDLVRPPIERDDVVEVDAFPWRLVVGTAVLVVIVLSPILAKFVRRRWRRRGPPARVIAGAWKELRDRGRDRGIRVTRSVMPRDLAPVFDGATTATGDDALDALATIHDAALFGQTEPDRQAAATAWSLVPTLARRAGQRRSWLRRLLAPFDPRSLRPPPVGKPVEPTMVRRDRADDESVIDLRDGSDDGHGSADDDRPADRPDTPVLTSSGG